MSLPGAATSQANLEEKITRVYALYTALFAGADAEAGLGGRLLYAGELSDEGALLVRAANIAGAASLSAIAEPAAQKLAIREGIVDFVVSSLDEALRILKNEVRKRQAVSVGVTRPAHAVLSEMIERGVTPDLLPPAASGGDDDQYATLLRHGARVIEPPPGLNQPKLNFSARNDAKFEQAAAQLPAEDVAAHRWLRLSSRYLGPDARHLRSLPAGAHSAADAE